MKNSSRREPVLTPATRLEGEGVVLRRPVADDFWEWAQLRAESRAFLTPWEPVWAVDALTETAFQRRLRRIETEWREGEGYTLHVYDRGTGRLVGGISLTQVKRGIAQSGVIGYWIGQRHARQGYTLRATRLVTSFAFQRLGLHRVEATCLPSNEASRRLLEKLGFVQEGYARSYLKIAGEWADHLLYAMIESDWKQGTL